MSIRIFTSGRETLDSSNRTKEIEDEKELWFALRSFSNSSYEHSNKSPRLSLSLSDRNPILLSVTGIVGNSSLISRDLLPSRKIALLLQFRVTRAFIIFAKVLCFSKFGLGFLALVRVGVVSSSFALSLLLMYSLSSVFVVFSSLVAFVSLQFRSSTSPVCSKNV
jgi:hypothetical protein